MKYLFIALFLYTLFKFFVLKNVKNKWVYIAFTVITIFFGIINLLYEPSFADLLKRWI